MTHHKILRAFLAFLLSFSLIAAPVYTYAVLPYAVAVAATAAGRVLAGQTLKKVAPTALGRAGKFCITHPRLCGSAITAGGSILAAIIADGYEIEIGETNNTTNNDIDINIYKIDENLQSVCYVPQSVGDDLSKVRKTKQAACQTMVGHLSRSSNGYTYLTKGVEWDTRRHRCIGHGELYHNGVFQFNSSGQIDIKETDCPSHVNKIYLTDVEMAQYIYNYGDENDILNIYNYDYSQHPNITINGDTYTGDTINNNIKNDSEGPVIKVSPKLVVKIKGKEVNIDDVNDDNCSKDTDGTYDDCFKKPDDPDDPDKPFECPAGTHLVNARECAPDDDKTCPVDYELSGGVCIKKPEEGEVEPWVCSTSDLTRKFCNWMDWTKKESAKPVNTKVDIKKEDDPEIDENLISLSQSCPANISFNVSLMGKSYSFEFDNKPACDIATMIKPFVIAAGSIAAIYTYAGVGRSNSEVD